MSYTKEDILRIAEEENVRFIRLQFTDLLGTVKNVEIPVSQLKKALDNKMMFDGSSIEGYVRIEESDMYLYPDLDTWVIFPWVTEDRVARLICDVYMPDGTPFAGDPRGILKRNLKEAEKMGYTSMNVGPEPEFFLFKTDEKGNPTMELNDQGGYFDLAPTDLGENCRREIVLTLEEMGFEIEASHHEVAPGQHEIDFKYENAIKAADQIQTFKLVVKTIARQHGLHATFMPKPLFGVNGSGMHCHQSLFKGDVNAFYDESDELGLSKEARYYMAKHPEARARVCGDHQPDRKLLQTSGSGLRSSMLRSMVRQQPQPDDPDPGFPRSQHARRSPQPGPCGESLSGACRHASRRFGRHQQRNAASCADRPQYLCDVRRRAHRRRHPKPVG